jgi:hypothetical protein
LIVLDAFRTFFVPPFESFVPLIVWLNLQAFQNIAERLIKELVAESSSSY